MSGETEARGVICTFKKIMSDCLTEKDNRTYDHSKILGVLSFLTYFGLSVYNIHKGNAWSPVEFSGGISAMAVSFGVNLKLKRRTEHGAN